jgi:hypothetical protein
MGSRWSPTATVRRPRWGLGRHAPLQDNECGGATNGAGRNGGEWVKPRRDRRGSVVPPGLGGGGAWFMGSRWSPTAVVRRPRWGLGRYAPLQGAGILWAWTQGAAHPGLPLRRPFRTRSAEGDNGVGPRVVCAGRPLRRPCRMRSAEGDNGVGPRVVCAGLPLRRPFRTRSAEGDNGVDPEWCAQGGR